jgi:hypothetical protein
LEALIEEYEAVSDQWSGTLDEGYRARLQRRLKSLDKEIEALGKQLARIPLAQTLPSGGDRQVDLDTLPDDQNAPKAIDVLRAATKLVVGDVAQALTGSPWKALRQDLLTRASKFPRDTYLDTALMQARAPDVVRLVGEVRTLLAAHRLEPETNRLDGTVRRAAELADYLIAAYRLRPGDAPALDLLVALGKRVEKQ